MDYIVLDMEWNQPWPGSPSSRKVLPVDIRGEIIQIGAVRLTEERVVADEFQVLIKPKYYRHLNRRVSKLTGIKENQLKEDGIPFPAAMEQFKRWCGEDIIFLTWGFDDIGILRENLQLHGLETNWTEKWYNAQMIFNAQTDGSTAQKALKTAMEMFGIEAAYDGHTLYMYSEDTEELTLSIPTEEELVQTNPFLYAQALLPACQYAEKVTGNTTEITLTPKDPAAGISKFVLQITTTTLLPSLVEIHETGNKTTTLLLSNAVYTEAKPAFIIEKEGVFVNDLR